MSEAQGVPKQAEFPDAVPVEWTEIYTDLTITPQDESHDFLYGVRKKDGKKDRLSWEPLDAEVAQAYTMPNHDQEYEIYKKDPAAWIENRRELYLALSENMRDSKAYKEKYARLQGQNKHLAERNEALEAQLADVSQLIATKIEEATASLHERIEELEAQGEGRKSSKVGLKDRVVGIYGGGTSWLAGNRSKYEYDSNLSEQDKQTKRRNRRVALVAGAVGLLLLSRYGLNSDGLSEEQVAAFEDNQERILENQAKIIADLEPVDDIYEAIYPNGADADSAFTEIEDKIARLEEPIEEIRTDVADIEEIVDPNGPEELGDAFTALSEEHGVKDSPDGDSLTEQHIELGDQHQGSDDGEEASIGEGHVMGGGSTASLEAYGDTISEDVQTRLTRLQGFEPTDEQIRKATQKVLDMNNLSWDSARRLPVGYSYEMPPNLLEIANR